MEKIVILGNGIAGHNALNTILKSQEDVHLTLVARENCRTYLRTQLASWAMGEIEDKKFFSCDENFYGENNVDFVNDVAKKIDTQEKKVLLKSGKVLEYDKLIVAVGSYNFIPPAKIEGSSEYEVLDKDNLCMFNGICTLRELSDALVLRKAMNGMKKAVIVGGGLLGLEAAWELKEKGIDVTVVEFSQRLLPRQMDTDSSLMFREIAEKSGINLILGDSVTTVVVENNVIKGVKTSKGLEIPCDYLQFSIGIRPHTELAIESNLATNRGIMVDDFMKTSADDVYACGDCCEYNGMVYGIWPFAMNSGKVAALNCLGKNEAIKPSPLSTLYSGLNTKIFSTGSVDFDDPSLENVTSGDKDKDYIKLFFKDDILKAAILIGDTKLAPKLSKAIQEGMSKETSISTFISR